MDFYVYFFYYLKLVRQQFSGGNYEKKICFAFSFIFSIRSFFVFILTSYEIS